MISFCGYNFCSDSDALNPFPTNVSNIKSVQIQNAVYDQIDISKNIDKEYSTDKPIWDFDTILDTDFINGVGAGNVDFALAQLSSIKIKRRKLGDFNWITIQEIPINSEADLNLVKFDYLVPSYEEFEYAIVPILNGVEGQYIISSIKTEFDGIFITDVTNTFKLSKNVNYGNRTSNQSVGQITTLGSTYPIITKNGATDYESGSISGILLGKNYDETHEINRKDVVAQVNDFTKFLKNGKPKIIKDWNSNIWICQIASNPSVTYNNNYTMGIATVNFEWVEQGKYDNEDDLYNNGFIDVDI